MGGAYPMTLSWTGWETDPSAAAGISPYIDWLKAVSFDGQDEKDDLSIAPLPLSPLAALISGNTTSPAPLPGFARPGATDTVAADPLIELTWMPDQDCTIVGVIDSAISLAHARFRRLDGGSRFLSAWLQGGDWRSGAAVPFGRELFRTEIDRLMFRAMVAGAIDEPTFDRSAGLTQFGHARGDRRLENNATHGTFVTDLAAGFDLRQSSQDEFRRRLPIIGVGLPPRTSMGSSGNFLEFFATHAVEYIVDRADRIWRACGYDEGGGFPIVINMSYGLQAGPKDGFMLIEEVLRAIESAANAANRPIRVILPAGNDLLSEGAAAFDLGPGDAHSIDWRISPEDHTPNYAELWSDELPGNGGPHPHHPLNLSVSPPHGPHGPVQAGQHGQRMTLVDDSRPDVPLARIYCRKHAPKAQGAHPNWHRVAYVVCTAPTLSQDRMFGAPAGRWSWVVSAASATRGYAYVQSDQSLTFGSDTGLVSTFAHPDFKPRDEFGRFIDVYSYPTDGSAPQDTDATPPMRRRGTMNAIASLPEARVIGSYRATDGKPSTFSSAATSDVVGVGRAAPTSLLPGADGAARFGLMAAGSKSGSAAIMGGTSFSTALATRSVALAMLDWIDGGRSGTPPGDEVWFQAQANQDESQANWPGTTMPEKGGFGRLTAPANGRMPR